MKQKKKRRRESDYLARPQAVKKSYWLRERKKKTKNN